ncbi:tetratricopeptide repeat protein [soil metagenome]
MRWWKISLAMFFIVLLYGCAAERLNRDGMTLIEAGQLEEGIRKLDEAAKLDPANLQFRVQAINKRTDVVNRLILSAANERAVGRYDEAERLLQRVIKLDAANVRAISGISDIEKDRRHAGMVELARNANNKNETEKAIALLNQVKAENPNNTEMLALQRVIDAQQAKDSLAVPTLKSLSKKPVTLEFRDANLKMVFEVLSRSSGINFVLDKDVRSDIKTTLFLKQASLEDAVDLLIASNQLEKKVLNQNSVLIYPSTPAKLKDYQDLVVKSFYLANADVKQTSVMIKTLLKSKDIFIDEKLNLLMMRDTPDAIRLAEKLIAMQDLSEPEVMLEVEVLEIKRSRLLNLGVQFPNQLSLAPLPSNGTTLTLSDLIHGKGGISAALPNAVISMKKEDSNVNLLANPRIRVRNREKAKILIGDKVPVITTSTSATGFISESVQYLDVGLKLEVEPNIYLQDDVGIKVALEVSSIANQIRSSSGTLTYQIGTRNASSVLRLKDGETQILAGLISDEDRSIASKVPGLGDLPVLGRLFASHSDDNQKTEIVLSITPHLIRNIKRPGDGKEEVWSGTEATLRLKPLTVQSVNPTAVSAQAAARPAVTSTATSTATTASQNASLPAIMLAPVAAPTTTSAAAIELSWHGPAQAKVGEQFKVALLVKSQGELRSLPFQVNFDPKLLQVIDVTEGGFFRQDGAKTNFVSSVDQSGGKINVGIDRPAAGGAKGEETIAIVTFKALSATASSEVQLLPGTPRSAGAATPAINAVTPFVIAVGH